MDAKTEREKESPLRDFSLAETCRKWIECTITHPSTPIKREGKKNLPRLVFPLFCPSLFSLRLMTCQIWPGTARNLPNISQSPFWFRPFGHVSVNSASWFLEDPFTLNSSLLSLFIFLLHTQCTPSPPLLFYLRSCKPAKVNWASLPLLPQQLSVSLIVFYSSHFGFLFKVAPVQPFHVCGGKWSHDTEPGSVLDFTPPFHNNDVLMGFSPALEGMKSTTRTLYDFPGPPLLKIGCWVPLTFTLTTRKRIFRCNSGHAPPPNICTRHPNDDMMSRTGEWDTFPC